MERSENMKNAEKLNEEETGKVSGGTESSIDYFTKIAVIQASAETEAAEENSGK